MHVHVCDVTIRDVTIRSIHVCDASYVEVYLNKMYDDVLDVVVNIQCYIP